MQKRNFNIIRNIKYKLLLSLGLFVLSAVLVKSNPMILVDLYTSNVANAQTTGEIVRDGIGSGIKLLTEFAFIFLYPVIGIVGKLMSNEWAFGGADLMTLIQGMWVIIRNLVNLIFALVLIYIAFINVTGISAGKQDTYAISSAVPKIIAGIVIINFSLFFCKFMIDVGAVAANAIVSIPTTLIDDKFYETLDKSLSEEGGQSIWRTKIVLDREEAELAGLVDKMTGKTKVDFGSIPAGTPYADAVKSTTNPFERYTCKIPRYLVLYFDKESKFTQKSDASDPANSTNIRKNLVGILDITTNTVLSYKDMYGEPGLISKDAKSGDKDYICVNNYTDLVMSPRNLVMLLATQLVDVNKMVAGAQVETIESWTINAIFNFVFIISVFLAVLGLCFALVGRTISLWIMMILSPVWVALYFLPGALGEGISKNSGGIGLNINNFLALVFMPAMLCVPFVLAYIFGTFAILFGGTADPISSLQLGGVTIFLSGLPVSGFDSIYHLFAAIIAIIALWMGLKIALSSSSQNDIVKSFTTPVINFADSLGGLAKSIPQYGGIPIPTTNGVKYASFGGLTNAVENTKRTGVQAFQNNSVFGAQVNDLRTAMGNLATRADLDDLKTDLRTIGANASTAAHVNDTVATLTRRLVTPTTADDRALVGQITTRGGATVITDPTTGIARELTTVAGDRTRLQTLIDRIIAIP